MNNNSSKQVLLSVIGVAILVVAVVGVSFAFYYFTTTNEAESTITTGTINFTATSDNIVLSNVFPTATADDLENTKFATINITGNTTYASGVSYYVYAEEITNDLPTAFPIALEITHTGDIGFSTGDVAKTITGNAQQLLCHGTIPGSEKDGTTPVNGTITIKAFVDSDNVLISNNKREDIPTSVLGNKTLITENEWNNKTLSFKIRVVATSGPSNLSTTDRVQP